MQNKYLILEFKNAGFFKTTHNTKDFVADINGRVKRSECEFYKEPINVNQISNMLHVLFGERPVPSLRSTVFKKIDYYYDKALNSYLKIDSYKRLNKTSNTEEYVSEAIQTKKMNIDSWSTSQFSHWERIHKLLGKDLYENLLYIVKELLDKTKNDITFLDACDELSKNKNNQFLNDFYDKLKLAGRTSVANFIRGGDKTEINKRIKISDNFFVSNTVTGGIDKIVKLSGTIIVPVNNEDIKKLQSSKGFATLLDGGTVYIKKLQSSEMTRLDGFTIVSDISTEKTTVKKQQEERANKKK